LKHRFIEVTDVAFRVGEEAENEIKFDPLKHRFTNFIHVALSAIQMT